MSVCREHFDSYMQGGIDSIRSPICSSLRIICWSRKPLGMMCRRS